MTQRSVLWILVLLFVSLAGPTLYAQGLEAAGALNTPQGQRSQAEWHSGIVWAFLSSSFLEWLKRNRRITFISDRLAWGAQRLLGVLLAVGTAAGIQMSFDATAGVLTVSGLIWPSIFAAVQDSIRQFVMQEITYRVAVKNYRAQEV